MRINNILAIISTIMFIVCVFQYKTIQEKEKCLKSVENFMNKYEKELE